MTLKLTQLTKMVRNAETEQDAFECLVEWHCELASQVLAIPSAASAITTYAPNDPEIDVDEWLNEYDTKIVEPFDYMWYRLEEKAQLPKGYPMDPTQEGGDSHEA